MSDIKFIDGGVTSAKGYVAAGVNAGIRSVALDVALLVSESPAAIAGTFTSNKVQGATVKLCKEKLNSGPAQAVVINSGNANACNGEQGMKDAVRMCELTAELTGFDEKSVYVCSTGTIGVPMPMDKVEAGINAVSKLLSKDGGNDSAKAIMTTDTIHKEVAVEVVIDDTVITVGGMAKGAGMIEPNMATMLAFVTTDAAVSQKALQSCLSVAVAESFNRISVDGDQSCNDTVLLMANGQAGNSELSESHSDWHLFEEAVAMVTKKLALMIVKDGEGATKFVTVQVKGAVTDEDAAKVTRAVANSLLVKTSWFGEDPNWGRVIDAVGYSGADLKEDHIDISYDSFFAVKSGSVAVGVDIKDLEKVLKQDDFTVTIDLNIGEGSDTVYTCDCSHEYVSINSEYTT